MTRRLTTRILGPLGVCAAVVAGTNQVGSGQRPEGQPVQPAAVAAAAPAERQLAQRQLIDRYCVTCHNDKLKTGGLVLGGLDLAAVGDHADTWEKVVRKVKSGLMPPSGARRPEPQALDGLATFLESELDRAATARPNPGRTETFHRLNRVEYKNAVHDVLALDVDVQNLLPADTASHGFDNVVGGTTLSESLMERYLLAARQVSRTAVGAPPSGPAAEVFKISPALPQDVHVEGLPFGTRGGAVVTHMFPQDAEYVFRFELANTTGGADLDMIVDGEPVKTFAVKRGARATDADGNEINEKLEHRLAVTAGRHEIGATFVGGSPALPEAVRRPFLNPTVSRPASASLRSITVTGPFDATGAGDTASRNRIFSCHPAGAAETACATAILSRLARHAYRRPVDHQDLDTLLVAYRAGAADAGFERGIERAVQQLLVSPAFLFRLEVDPASAVPGSNYRLADLDLASRLSFFLWSSVPDDALLDVASKGKLHEPAVLEQQTRRMLADPKAEALTANFAGQWLQLRNLDAAAPSAVLFPDFDSALKTAFRRETELFFDSVLREDRSALELLTANYTFVNERLARHYGIAHVSGSQFRRVTLPDNRRPGLLGQGSILTITSHPVRTSPVFRGKWVLDNVLGTPPPPPPPNVPALAEKTGVYAARQPSMRERMQEHRANPACATCHAMIDPLGFGLEQFDPVGRFREVDELYKPIDATGVLPDGTKFNGAAELSAALVAHPERFVTTLTERLLTYALGRGLEPYDMTAVRTIVHRSAGNNYSLRSIVLGIIDSFPFQYRRVPS